MNIRPILTRCAATALCCALLTAPMTAEASALDLFRLAKNAASSAGKILKDPSLPVIATLFGFGMLMDDSNGTSAYSRDGSE